ncbi:MAG: acylphosphatase [Hyphomicrobiales bacterium]|nr:acylphosphatase [Hyphomicrobiales bacterium]
MVQGVAYRAWTERAAGGLGLTGWVRNRRDGSVEALFCGPAEAVDRMVGLCAAGPPAARVTDVRAEPFSGDLPPPPFQVLPTV